MRPDSEIESGRIFKVLLACKIRLFYQYFFGNAIDVRNIQS